VTQTRTVPAHRERRHYPRLPEVPLMANIGGRLVRVLDISATGLTVEKLFPMAGDGPVPFTLYPCDGRRLDLNHGMPAAGAVVHDDGTQVGLRFEPASLRLVKFVAEHLP
jgi:hypothetical protein